MGDTVRRNDKQRVARWVGWTASLLMLWAAAGGASAQSQGDESAACDPAELICIDVLEEDGDAVTARWDGAARMWIVEPPTGSVQIRHGDDTVTARRMRLQEEDEYARLEGDVVVLRTDARAESDALDLWWSREEYVFTGDVVFVQFETGDEGDGSDGERAAGAVEPVEARTVRAREIHYFGETKDARADGDVYMVDDQYEVWSQQMVYQHEPEEMTFTGRVRVQSADGEWVITGEHFFYDLEAEEGHLIGPHRIQLTPRD